MRLPATLALFFSCFTCFAQWDIGVGAQLGFPLLYNKNVGTYNHSLGSIGPMAVAKYYPANTTFYPSLLLHVTNIRLPLAKQNGTVVGMIFQQLNFVVGANIRKVNSNRHELHYGLGIGASYLDAQGIEIEGSDQGNVQSVSVDASNHITRWVPAIVPRIEYIFPISADKPLYAGISGQVQYIYFFDDGSAYTVQVVDNQYRPIRLNAALLGHMVNPAVQVSVYYRFGQSGVYR